MTKAVLEVMVVTEVTVLKVAMAVTVITVALTVIKRMAQYIWLTL